MGVVMHLTAQFGTLFAWGARGSGQVVNGQLVNRLTTSSWASGYNDRCV